jgi:hypothetical protein
MPSCIPYLHLSCPRAQVCAYVPPLLLDGFRQHVRSSSSAEPGLCYTMPRCAAGLILRLRAMLDRATAKRA